MPSGKVGGDDVGELGGLVRAQGGGGFLVERLLELAVLLKELVDAADQLVGGGGGLEHDLRGLDGGDEEAVFVVDFRGAGALDAFDEDLDVAVGHADGLDDVADDADGVYVVGGGLVYGGVVLGGEEDAAVAVEGFFERADGGLTADDEGRHHVGEDDHLADGHHGEFALRAGEDIAFVVRHGHSR